MKRIRLTVGISLLLGGACAEAAIPLDSLETFETAPKVGEWGWLEVFAGSGSILTPQDLDRVIQTNDVSIITRALDTSHIRMRWNSNGYIQSRANDVAYQVLLATIQNTSSSNLSSIAISYDFGNPIPASPAVGGESPGLNGLRAYYSFNGQPNTWWILPEFSTGETGNVSAVIPLWHWPPNSLLYLLWADDNGPGTDGTFSIDNFIAMESLPPLSFSGIQPLATNVVELETIRLTALATGYGLTYQWFKNSLPIDTGVNPTAKRASLIITNAQFTDSGQYHVVVSNAVSVATSAVAVVQVVADTIPPRMVHFSPAYGSTNSFRLAVTEPLCFDTTFSGQCPGEANAAFVFSWLFGEFGAPTTYFPDSIAENGTNYVFTFSGFAIDPNRRYYLMPDPNGQGIIDRFGNPLSGSITSSPVRIFGTDIADAEIHSHAQADTALGTATSVTVDNDDAGIAQGLLRFNNLIGPGENQIFWGATILDATLILNQTDYGSPARFHRMLVGWDQATVTWNSLTNGVTADGVEAVATNDGISLGESFPNGPMHIDVTPSVQAWAYGAFNHGWAILSTGTGGWDFSSAESDTPPILVVSYHDNREPFVPSFVVHPASVTVTEGNSFTLTASVSGAVSATYQWTKDNVDIPGATGSFYTAVGVPGPSGNGGNYRLRVTNPNGTATSNPALVTVNPDLTAPFIIRVTGSADGTTVTLRFSKPLSTAGTYAFDPAVADVTAALNNGAHSATVTVTSAARTLTTPYRLTVTGARDNRVSQNFISPNPSVIDLTGVIPVLPFAGAGNWNYATNDQAANPNWKNGTLGPDWLVGEQFFGFEPSASVTSALPIQPNPIKTPLQANDTNVLGFGNSEIFVSQYFHRQVTLPALELNTVFALSFYVDDGAIFYLDGVEIGRYQMPAGPATFTTRSTGGNGEAVLQTLLFSAGAGTHHLAVEVHQAGLSSSDVLFGLEINKVTLPSELAIERNQGTNIVSWTADTLWGLTSSSVSAGTYAPVAGNPIRTFRVSPAAQTNATFYRLQYTP